MVPNHVYHDVSLKVIHNAFPMIPCENHCIPAKASNMIKTAGAYTNVCQCPMIQLDLLSYILCINRDYIIYLPEDKIFDNFLLIFATDYWVLINFSLTFEKYFRSNLAFQVMTCTKIYSVSLNLLDISTNQKFRS